MQSQVQHSFVHVHYEISERMDLKDKYLFKLKFLKLIIVKNESSKYVCTYSIDSYVTATMISFIRYNSCLLTIREFCCIFFRRILPNRIRIINCIRHIIRSTCAVTQRSIWDSVDFRFLGYACNINYNYICIILNSLRLI